MRFLRDLAPVLALLLASCGGGGPSPPPPGPPVPEPRPGVQTFAADWSLDPLGIALRCGGPGLSEPFGCDLPATARWGVLPQEGGGGSACVDPTPNGCFQPSGGRLGFHSGDPGMALISAGTFPNDRPVSIQAEVTVTAADCTKPVAYVGPVLYDGEGIAEGQTGKYAALYITCWTPGGDRDLHVAVYTGTHDKNVTGPVAVGSTHVLRIDHYPGNRRVYSVDGVVVMTESPGSLTPGPFDFAQRPHVGIWFGNVGGSIGPFDVYEAP